MVRKVKPPSATIIRRRPSKESMQNSDADFFFLVSSVPMMVPHSGAGGFEFDEAHWRKVFDYPLDVFRISANAGVDNFIKKRPTRTIGFRLMRLRNKLVRLWSRRGR